MHTVAICLSIHVFLDIFSCVGVCGYRGQQPAGVESG